VIIRSASSLAQDRESSPVKDQCFTTVLRRQLREKRGEEREEKDEKRVGMKGKGGKDRYPSRL